MALTQADLDAFDAALSTMLADGMPQRVTYDGKTVEYRSLDDLIKARSLVASLVASAAGTPSRSSVAAFSKG